MLTVDVEAGVDVVVDSPCVVDGSLGVGVGSGVGVGFGLVLLLTKVVPISPVYPSGFLFNAAVTPDDDVIIGLSQEISYKEAVSMI